MTRRLSHSAKEETPVGAPTKAHVCGACNNGYDTDAEYLAHKCKATKHKPTEVEHQDALTDGNFSRISKTSLKRGKDRKDK